jgi:hypothetical protein
MPKPVRSAKPMSSAELVTSTESALALNCTHRYHEHTGAELRQTRQPYLLRDRTSSNRQDGDITNKEVAIMQQIP